MQPDIVEKINKDFDNPDEVIRIVEAFVLISKHPEADRVCRAVIFGAKGDLKRLHECIDDSFFDCRGYLRQAENEGTETQKYDFNQSFSELGLL